MCPYRYYDIMRESKDPRQLRYQMVLSVEKAGIRETARSFRVSRTTVRKWHWRWQEQGRYIENVKNLGGYLERYRKFVSLSRLPCGRCGGWARLNKI